MSHPPIISFQCFCANPFRPWSCHGRLLVTTTCRGQSSSNNQTFGYRILVVLNMRQEGPSADNSLMFSGKLLAGGVAVLSVARLLLLYMPMASMKNVTCLPHTRSAVVQVEPHSAVGRHTGRPSWTLVRLRCCHSKIAAEVVVVPVERPSSPASMSPVRREPLTAEMTLNQ